MRENNNFIRVMVHPFYGKYCNTEIRPEKFDLIMRGVTFEEDLCGECEPDRTVIELPNTDGIVAVYNKYQEENIHFNAVTGEEIPEDNLFVSLYIPESGVKVHSRVIICRLDENGNPTSLRDGDSKKFMKYLP